VADLSKILDLLHTGLAEVLLEKIQSGEVTASDLNVARQFLKDNGIDSVPKEGSPLDNLAHSLPFTANEDEEAAQLPN
jgi:hypothetical protein